jgi:hypothetical protein
MCVSPSFIWIERGPKWEQQEVPCKLCWRCQQNRVNDFVGRCLAETSVSSAVCTLTLTYAPRDDLADKVITPYHFQLFIKLLRRAGHKIRYIVAGEYGDAKGRAHFHAILFFTDIRPRAEGRPVPFYNWNHGHNPETSGPFCAEIPQQQNCHISEWPHGHIFADWSASEKAIRYICKYVLKDRTEGWLSMSKKPPLGAAFFAQKAARAIELGVMPASFNYLPPGGSREKPYMMRGATRRDYIKAIADVLDPPDHRLDEWVLKSLEKARKWAFLRDATYPPLRPIFTQEQLDALLVKASQCGINLVKEICAIEELYDEAEQLQALCTAIEARLASEGC